MPKFFREPFDLDRIARIVFSLMIIAAVFLSVRYLWVMLVPFIIAWITASLLEPAVLFFQYKLRLRFRLLSVIVVLVLIVSILSGIVALLIPSIVTESKKAWELVSFYFTPELLLSLVPEKLRPTVVESLNLDDLMSNMQFKEIVTYAQSIFEKGWGLLSGTLSILSNFTVVGLFTLYLFFILLGYDKLMRGFMGLVPHSLKPFVERVGHDINVYVGSYFRGQGLIALICGLLLALGFWIMGLPLGITMGLIMGALNLIPYMQILGILPIIILCLLQSADTGQSVWIIFLIAFGIVALVQMLQDFYLTPTIMGRRMGMHPAAILLSLSIWGYLLGFWGLIFALPLTMIVYDLYVDYIIGDKPLDEPFTGKKVNPLSRLEANKKLFGKD